MSDQKSDHSNAAIFLLMGAVIILILFGHYFFYYFLYLWKSLLIPISFVFKYIPNAILNVVFFWVDGDKQKIFDGIYKLIMGSSNNFFNENRESYSFINNFISKTIGPFLYAFLLYTSHMIYKKKMFNIWLTNTKSKNPAKNKTAVDKLIEAEAEVWPNVKFLINEHPELEKDINKGKWRVAETPDRFLTNQKVYKSVKSEEEDDLYTIDVPKLRESLREQMGKQWLGIKNTELTKYEKQIFSIILLKMLRNGAESLRLKKLISTTHSTEIVKFYQIKKKYKRWSTSRQVDKIVDKTIAESVENPAFKELEFKHAYFYTLIMEMLELSRKDGVSATDYIWLRIKDRHLYMILNNVGRRVAFAETAGPWSHRIAEKEKNVRINSPKVNAAILAFDDFIERTDEKYVKIDM